LSVAAFLRHLLFCGVLAGLSASTVQMMVGLGIMDRPDPRKAHSHPVPKCGGVGPVIAFLAGIFILYHFAAFSRLADPYFRGVILASMAIAAVSLADDLRDFPFTVKLIAQLMAALLAIGSGLYITVFRLPWIGAVDTGWFGLVLTLGWILFATNAMNFIDGLTGLASGVTAIACLFLALIGALSGGWFVYFAALLLAAGLIGFIPFNFPRARIFMGDVGSQFCGFVLAVLGVAASGFEAVDMSFLLVPLLLSGALYDVAFTLIRRLLAGQRVTTAHRGHLYQVAHRSGMPAVNVTLVHWGFAIWGGVTCLLFVHAAGDWKLLLVLLPVPLQLAWTGYVVARARRAGLGKW
jgi:UDP-GlcNAc:undecaprenyl-phosphate GlcNAc-1-phosphate transferase